MFLYMTGACLDYCVLCYKLYLQLGNKNSAFLKESKLGKEETV
jgi:hypothetical protein